MRKSPGRSGSTKVQLAERRAGRDVVVEHIGTARGEAELAVLMAEARRRLRPGQDAFDLDVGGLAEPGVRFSPHRALHEWLLFSQWWLSVSMGSGSGSRGSGTG